MCLAIPAEILSIDKKLMNAEVGIGQIKKNISLALVDDLRVGDFVLLHVGFAIAKIDKDEAERTLQLFEEAGMLAQAETRERNEQNQQFENNTNMKGT